MFMAVKAHMERGDLLTAADLEADYWLAGPHRRADEMHNASSLRMLLHEMNRIAVKNSGVAQSAERLEKPLEPPAITRLSEIHAPTLVISGDRDDSDVLKGAQMVATRIPNAQKAVVAETAHMLNMEKPEVFNRLVLDFLAAL